MINNIGISSQRLKIAVAVVLSGVLISVMVSVRIWSLSIEQHNSLIKRTSIAKSELIEHHFASSMPAIINALERMRNRWIARQGPPFSEWQLDAQDYVNDHAGLRAVEWVNKDYIVKWVVPLEGNESAVDLNLTFEANRKQALDLARDLKTYTLSKPVQLVQGGKGFLAYFPIFVGSEFEGFILGVFDVSLLVDSLLPHKFIEDHNIEILSGNEVMYSKKEAELTYDDKTGHTHSFSLYDVKWDIAVWPRKIKEGSENSNIHYIALFNGVLISLLAGIALFYLLKSLISESIISAKDAEHKATLENAIDGIITLDSKGVIRGVNTTAEQIFDRQRGKLIGQKLSALFAEPFRSDYEQCVWRKEQLEEGCVEIGKVQRVAGMLKNGHVFPLDLGITTFEIHKEQLFCCVVKDVSVAVKLAEEKEKLIQQLSKSNEELDNFAYIASHDLKEPLRAIQNHACFLKEDYESILGSDGVYKLDRLVYLGAKMERLISDLMYYSRLGREEPDMARFNMVSAIKSTQSRLSESLEEHGADVTISSEFPTVYGNRTRIEELLYNLIVNGYKYNLSDKKVINIRFDENLKAYCVEDNGIGIDSQFGNDVFKIFKRLNSPKKFGEGSGAGLTIAQKIVERHGGRIWYESELGSGTRFYFTLKDDNQNNEGQ
ncbi:hypothetical protein N480_10935 [Pseudoalteromonas luteoviolacea S2607]|uniref:ATP-binding protein n=1 Tax=Pseudoalteromonas luteoviolacea TaxID=43657 RepID=UPI0007B0BCD9|nr:ATP-binding protein [Pseudoalteromonas luteoviolacea]KZN28598.1 hypothetical protein N480_10935 [Pseudoalteromonas luteoviolacea S2607]